MRRLVAPPSGPQAYVFSEREVSRVIASVVEALRFLHARQILHGDVRPEHVVYEDVDPDASVLLADFGRAAHFASFTFRSRSLRGFLWANLHDAKFLPPFVLLHRLPDRLTDWPHAANVDVWALGVTAFVLLCGKFPFDGATLDQVAHNVQRAEVVFPGDVSRAARDLVTRLLERSPDRWLSIEDVASHPWIRDGVA